MEHLKLCLAASSLSRTLQSLNYLYCRWLEVHGKTNTEYIHCSSVNRVPMVATDPPDLVYLRCNCSSTLAIVDDGCHAVPLERLLSSSASTHQPVTHDPRALY
ncbi:hypothetical protein C7974DRAFT_399777 [Boeremia exigua]|uniref:uncharacterized protein n=1 Tax=Boeremia exigua TaxID=749465 RepID=UPI001E8DC9B1|nr:uncharacterized protein C7974DRAFT_399777 [Boeremia exigua]KAH6620464.1 hypothetical protein C7974DRAFT_399777 [Boeremia exigua]